MKVEVILKNSKFCDGCRFYHYDNGWKDCYLGMYPIDGAFPASFGKILKRPTMCIEMYGE
jgi:hypothetical protein